MWNNLKKTGDMVVGQIGFHRDKAVKKVGFWHLYVLCDKLSQVHIETKLNEIIRRLDKTKIEIENPDYQSEREERDSRVRAKEVCLFCVAVVAFIASIAERSSSQTTEGGRAGEWAHPTREGRAQLCSCLWRRHHEIKQRHKRGRIRRRLYVKAFYRLSTLLY